MEVRAANVFVMIVYMVNAEASDLPALQALQPRQGKEVLLRQVMYVLNRGKGMLILYLANQMDMKAQHAIIS